MSLGVQPLGVAVNAAGTLVYVANSDGTVSVIDAGSNAVMATFVTGGSLSGAIAVNPVSPRVYLTDFLSNNVIVIDASSPGGCSPTTCWSIPVGFSPMGIGVNPTGTRVYVANNGGTVSVINTATNAVVATVPIGTELLSMPDGIAVSPSGTLVYVTNSFEDTVAVIFAQTNTVVTNVPLPVGSSPLGIATDPTGARIFVGNHDTGTVSVIDAATNAVVASVPVGIRPDVFGAFVGGAPSTAASCDDQIAPLLAQIDSLQRSLAAANDTISTLQQQLRTANATIGDLTNQVAALTSRLAAANAALLDLNNQNDALKTQNTALQSQVAGLQSQVASLQQQLGTLPAENAKLKSDLDTANRTIASLVDRLFGARADANVAAVARDAAQSELTQATAKVGARDYRVKYAQKEFNEGLAALRAGHYQRAVREFRETFEICQRVLRH